MGRGGHVAAMALANNLGYTLLPTADVDAAGDPLLLPTRSQGGTAFMPSASWEKAPGQASFDVEDGKQQRPVASKGPRYEHGRRFDLSAGSWVMHPYDPRIQAWFMVLVALLMLDVVYLPLETAYRQFMNQTFVLWFNVISALLFTVDIVLQFFLQIPSENGEYWVFNHDKIIREYLRGSFAIDLLGVLPFSELLSFGQSRYTRYIFHMMRMVKLARLARFKRMVSRYVYEVNITYATRSMLYCFFAVLGTVHVVGCVWATMGIYEEGSTWVWALQQSKTKFGGHDYINASDGKVHPVVMYIMSTYFALYTLTGIGYGDVSPTTEPEFGMLLFLMLVGSLIWSSVVGEIVNVLQHSTPDTVQHREAMDAVVQMGEECEMSQDLRNRLEDYLLNLRSTTRKHFAREQVLGRLNSQIGVDLVSELHGGWLKNVWWLQEVAKTKFISHLIVAFEPALYCPSEWVRAVDRLYVVQRGLCLHGQTVLGKDQVWGVDCLLTQGHLRSSKTTVAMSYLHVIYISRNKLEAVMEPFPKEKISIRRKYRVLCLMRGMIYQANKIRAEDRRKERHLLKQSAGGTAAKLTQSPTPSITGREARNEAMQSWLPSSDPLQGRPDGPFDEGMCGALQAVRSAEDRLEKLEVDMDKRMDRIERTLQTALDAVATANKRKSSKRIF